MTDEKRELKSQTPHAPPPSKLLPVLMGGVVIGFIGATPFLDFLNCFCCAGVIFGGFLAVVLYKDKLTRDMPSLKSSDGVILGVLAGLAGSVFEVFLQWVYYIAFDAMSIEYLMNLFKEFDPEMTADFSEIITMINAFYFSPFYYVILVNINIVFGLIGGLIGSAVYKPKLDKIIEL
jgi:hypothetical protein